jgi:hypothetical protein
MCTARLPGDLVGKEVCTKVGTMITNLLYLFEDSREGLSSTYSSNLVEGKFSEVAPALLTVHTGHVDQLKAGPKGPALS